MPGGRRPGAGRPKGSRNRATEEARQKAQETGETPLEYMLRVMRDAEADEKRRDAMAQAAAPYIHAKLSSIEMDAKVEGSLSDLSQDELDRRIAEKLQGLGPEIAKQLGLTAGASGAQDDGGQH
jgi:uncharacterized protein with von Willebrand factor type A (vWA) domain